MSAAAAAARPQADAAPAPAVQSTAGVPAGLVTSVKILAEAQAALAQASEAKQEAVRKWAAALRTVEMAQQAVAMDMRPGDAVTVRVSQAEMMTVERVPVSIVSPRALRVTRSRLCAPVRSA